jgi:DNA polymerase-2
MKARGLILQASYRTAGGAPVVHLYGRFENGETFLIRDHRQRPHFFIEESSAPRAAAMGGQSAPAPQHTFAGTQVCRVDVPTPADAPSVRDRLHDAGIDTFEADVRFAVRYLIDRDIRGGLEVDGHATPGERINWVFDDPEVAPAAPVVVPTVLSFDIETDPKAERLLAIALYGAGADEVLVVDPEGRAMPDRATGFADEGAALRAFCARVAELDPDVLTGWNVVDFDLSVLARVAERVSVPFELGRDVGALRIRPAQGYFGSGNASIPGRLVLDGMDLVRGAFVRLNDYSLDAVAHSVLGEGKALEGDVSDRVGEILDRYHNDLPGFAHYARTDARLALDIVQRMDLVQLAVARSQLTGMTPDRVAASIASFDFLYLAELFKRDVVAPTVRSGDARVYAAQAGGYVLEPKTGMHENVWVFDFKSLYPSIMRTFNIDPLGFVADADPGQDLIALPGGAAFKREPAILPSMLDTLFPSREQAKRDGDQVASQAIKILMNSFYGVLGTPACRFHNPAIANAITGQGQHFLQWSKRWFENEGFEVLYGDTDSLFVSAGANTVTEAREVGGVLAQRLTKDVAEYITGRWRVESKLELEFEKLYLKLFLPSVRHGDAGARKRYAGVIDGGTGVEFVGMEVVRRDWTELAKQVQRELYARLFADEPVDAYLADTVARLRRGEFDDLLVYRKGLRKSLSEYTATTPPHVAAARKSTQKPGRIITYLMTTDGPEPLDNLRHQPDREHYVHKQVQPVAEPVLGALGLAFATVIGDDKQLDLF